MPRIDWKQAIVEMAVEKQRLHDRDPRHLWPWTLPRVRATEEQLAAAEAHLGEALDPEYRDFLLHAGGWKAFHQCVDLFGPEELLGGGLAPRAQEFLQYLDEEGTLALSSRKRAELLPIAVSEDDMDLFVMGRATSREPGMVIWYAAVEIDRFDSFGQFFGSMVLYTRREIVKLAH